MNVSKELLTDLDEDGAAVELPDGRTLRVRIEPDLNTDLHDYDTYGKVAWVERDRDYNRDRVRPVGFDGRAEKLWTLDGSDSFWWQPPWASGMPAEDLTRSSEHVRELVTFGFVGVIVELIDGTDAYGRPVVRDVASLWGIDTQEPEYVREVASELVLELDAPRS